MVQLGPNRTPDRELAAALLTGWAVCGYCGRVVQSELLSTGQVAYRCDADRRRPHLVRTAAPVDAWVRLLVLDRLERPGAPELLADPELADLDELRARSVAVGTRLARDAAGRSRLAGELAGELAGVEAEMTSPARRELPASLTGADPVELAWDRLDTDHQRAALAALAEPVALHPVPPGRCACDPDVLRGTIVLGWR